MVPPRALLRSARLGAWLASRRAQPASGLGSALHGQRPQIRPAGQEFGLDPLRAEEGGEAVHGLAEAGRVSPCPEQLERPRLAVEARLRAADETVADEQRQDVVAV